ncbi:MFS transporter [Janthinobacterium psychrotolerans]|uniref:MFS transporter, DHA2 family, multidrug resistance protein n=1 Tax=Janthinobacterium psychrotolerans TaxID=1747903 RepID=A0A1A7C5S9_9BURK|nr:MFS transporter [Janthinobacterium psychrotolerans]OBV41276.1 MFS transporter, DHA2 family, multidrug resistance protein [Janthinobacterium psychrotolerans]
MHTVQKWLTLAIVSSALFLIVVDMTVLYTALPALTHELQASSSQKLWIINIYSLVVCALLPGLGTLGDRLGHKPVFLAGLLVFGVASLCAAFSPAPAWLIASRILLALGAAMMMPATLSLIRLTFADARERSFAIGVWAAIASGGAAFGPVLGGFLLEHYWWGSVFLINVPVVLLTLVMAVVILPKRAGNTDKPWDILGSLQVMLGLLGGVYAIKEAGKAAPSYAVALLALLIGAFFMTIFVRRQNRQAQPMIDFALFRALPFSSAVAAAMVASAALIGMELALSQHLQLVRALSPLDAGLLLLPLPLASVVAGPLTGLMLPRADKAQVLWGSLLVSGLGMAGYLLLHDAAVFWQVASLVLLGLGLGAVMTAASSAVMLNVAPQQAGMAASIEEVSFELGGVLGVTILGTIMTAVYSATLVLPASAGDLPNAHDTLDAALQAAGQLPVALGLQVAQLARAAFDQAFVAVLATAAAILLLAAATLRQLHLRQHRADLAARSAI